jgi:AcrR family transcriptional regulator
VSSRSTRGPYSKTAEQRRRILDVALDVFGRLGNRGSSLREIADKVGMSQTGVLHHFGSKTNLLLAVLTRRDDHEREYDSVVAGTAALRDLLVRAQRDQGLTQLFATISAEATDPEHPARDFIVERYRRTLDTFVATIESSKQAGEVAPEVDSEALARLMVAAMDGLQLQALLLDDVDVLASYDLLVKALVPAIAPR